MDGLTQQAVKSSFHGMILLPSFSRVGLGVKLPVLLSKLEGLDHKVTYMGVP
jgi:hypothetical protein